MHTCWWPDAQAVGTLAAGQERIEQVLVHLCGQAGAHLGATLLGRTQASQGGNIFSSQGAMPSTAQQHPGAAAGASVATGSSPSTAAAADDQLLEDFLEELVSSKHIKRDVTAFWEAWDQGKINVNGKLLQLPVPWRQLELCFRSQKQATSPLQDCYNKWRSKKGKAFLNKWRHFFVMCEEAIATAPVTQALNNLQQEVNSTQHGGRIRSLIQNKSAN